MWMIVGWILAGCFFLVGIVVCLCGRREFRIEDVGRWRADQIREAGKRGQTW